MSKKDKKRRHKSRVLWIMILLLCVVGVGLYLYFPYTKHKNNVDEEANIQDGPQRVELTAMDIPQYSGQPSVEVNGNTPFFTADELTRSVYEKYSDLDELGRCGEAYACVGQEIMPTEERGEIGHIKPTGWKQAKYPDVVNSKPPYLYNRCHMIAYCLTGENDNEKNLITGTRYMNVEGMLPWETKVASYVDETGNHVMYRVTPDFRGEELLSRGVLIEAYSVEDKGEGICFCVYCYNVQPGVVIDYMTGESWLEE